MGKFKRLLCFVTAAVMALSCMSVAASIDASAAEVELAASQTQNRTAYFSKDFTLTGNYVDDFLNVARTQLGRRTDVMHYSEAWCANFVNDCARLTGMPDNIIPYNYSLRAGCRYLYNYMLENCNAKKITNTADLEPGDLVFYYCPSSDFYLHVGIVETPRVFYIEGNYGNQVRLMNFEYNYKCYVHSGTGIDFASGHVKRLYLRPNYGCKATPRTFSTNPEDYTEPTVSLAYDSMEMTYHNNAGWVQAILYQLGYLDKISGAYDKNTEDAVKKYQTDKKLDVDGIVGPITKASLKEDWKKKSFPTFTNIKVDKATYNYYDKISLQTKAEKADSVRLIMQNNGKETPLNGSSHTLDAESIGEGKYTAFFRLANKYATVETNKVTFTVKFEKPQKPNLSVTGADTYSEAEFKWDTDKNVVNYTLSIKNNSNGKTTDVKNLDEGYFAQRLEEGSYTATVSAVNKIGETKSDNINFTINKGSPLSFGDEFYASLSSHGKGVCSVNDTVTAGTDGSISSKWYFTRNSDGSYKLKSCGNGKYMTLKNDNAISLETGKNDASQNWYIGKVGDKNLLISVYDTSRVLCLNGSAAAKVYDEDHGEMLDLRVTDTVHNYKLTSYTAPDTTHEGTVTYTCIITNSVYTKTIPVVSSETNDADTADTPDNTSKPVENSEKNSFMIGDINDDKSIMAEDALFVLRCSVGLSSIDDFLSVCADVNFDLNVDSADAIAIQRYSVGLSDSEYIGKTITSM